MMSTQEQQTTTRTTTSNLTGYIGFMYDHKRKEKQPKETHTRMYGKYKACYYFPKEEMTTFHEHYIDHVFNKRNEEYLTEVQDKNGMMVIDLDFHSEVDFGQGNKRKVNLEMIENIIKIFLDIFKKFYDFEENNYFEIFNMLKPRQKYVNKKKDGIHMMFNFCVPRFIKQEIWNEAFENLSLLFTDLSLSIPMEKVLDKGVFLGDTNWQVYGSRKDDKSESYELVSVYKVYYRKTNSNENNESMNNSTSSSSGMEIQNENDEHLTHDFELEMVPIDRYFTRRTLPTLELMSKTSVTNLNFPLFNLKPEYVSKLINFNRMQVNLQKKKTKRKSASSLSSSSFVSNRGGGGGGGYGGDMEDGNEDDYENDNGVVLNQLSENMTEEEEMIYWANKSISMLIPENKILNIEILKNQCEFLYNRDNLHSKDYYLVDLHEFVKHLPRTYYGPGTHFNNRKVAFALKNTDDRMFLSYLWLRARAQEEGLEEFDFNEIPEWRRKWNTHFCKNNDNDHGNKKLSRYSIYHWVKTENPEAYKKIRAENVELLVNSAINDDGTDWSLGMIVHAFCKDTYVCVNMNPLQFYTFRNHRWEMDPGMSIGKMMSREIYELFKTLEYEYGKKKKEAQKEFERSEKEFKESKTKDGISDQEERELSVKKQEYEKLKSQKASLDKCLKRLHMSADKNAILRQAALLLFDESFLDKRDADMMLLGCLNGVLDFSDPIEPVIFRPGDAQDYITKSTKINYLEEVMEEDEMQVNEYMEKLFPYPDLRQFVWDFLAGCLVGSNTEQTFNIWLGKGGNGKSLLCKLLKFTFNDYYGTVPITYITKDRTQVGSATPEIAKLQGIRVAVMQEPSKNSCQIKEGQLKEITGGDLIEARSLFQSPISFIPQFQLIVCSNILFEFETMDDGTWRRINVIPFDALFKDLEKVTETERKTYLRKIDGQNEMKLCIYPKDRELETMLERLAPTFLHMLVKHYMSRRPLETKIIKKSTGETETKQRLKPYIVRSSKTVDAEVRKYKGNEDIIEKFIKEKLTKIEITGDCVDETQESEGISSTTTTSTKKRSRGPKAIFLTKSEINNAFTSFVNIERPNRKKPNNIDLYEKISEKFEIQPTTRGFKNLRIRYDSLQDSEDETIPSTYATFSSSLLSSEASSTSSSSSASSASSALSSSSSSSPSSSASSASSTTELIPIATVIRNSVPKKSNTLSSFPIITPNYVDESDIPSEDEMMNMIEKNEKEFENEFEKEFENKDDEYADADEEDENLQKKKKINNESSILDKYKMLSEEFEMNKDDFLSLFP